MPRPHPTPRLCTSPCGAAVTVLLWEGGICLDGQTTVCSLYNANCTICGTYTTQFISARITARCHYDTMMLLRSVYGSILYTKQGGTGPRTADVSCDVKPMINSQVQTRSTAVFILYIFVHPSAELENHYHRHSFQRNARLPASTFPPLAQQRPPAPSTTPDGARPITHLHTSSTAADDVRSALEFHQQLG